MGKFLLKFLLFFFAAIITAVMFLSYFGLETDKFDSFIKNKANQINKNVKLEFNKTKIYIDISNLKLLLKLQNPALLIKNDEINLLKLDLYLSLKSFYTSDVLLEKANVAFQKNNINDLTKISNIFLPRIINQQLKKVFVSGKLEGELVITFKQNGSTKEDYAFFGKIKEAEINLPHDYKIKKLTAGIGFGESSNSDKDELKIIIEKGTLLNLNLSGSFIDIKFEENKKRIESSLQTEGNLNYSEIKKILSLLRFKNEYAEDINLKSDLKTSIQFDIDKKFKITKQTYTIDGKINELQFKIKEDEKIKKFLPSFNPEIILKNTKIKFSNIKNNQTLDLKGDVKFSDKFEKFELNHLYNEKNIKHTINISSSLNGSSVKIKQLNYKKKTNINAGINFNAEIITDNYFLVNNLRYSEGRSAIIIKEAKLNNNLEIIDLKNVTIKTFQNNIKNNDFSIIKSDKIVIIGEVFDAEPLLQSLLDSEDKNIFSKKFNSNLEINLKKTITGTGDSVSDLIMIATIVEGSYNKLSLKGSFSESEIVEMSIYQINKDKKTLQVISDRARPFMKHFAFIEGFEGGKLEYESTMSNKVSNSNLKITDFKVSKVPALAQLLTLASLQGIADTLSGEGIRFDSFEMKSNASDNIMNIEDSLAMGPAVSILLEGYIDKGNTVSLRGTLVPATKLNSIIASIPLVGNILVGKKTGEGVVGVSFKMKGPPQDIKTTVNPIKTLTPRFIVRAIEKMKKNKKKKDIK